jgi:thymidylate synthase ThyX
MYSTRILKDSLAPCGKRLTTWELTYPRFVHAELMTHRLFSRNAASSRAIPIEKLIERVEQDPAMPVFWGKNQKGMQAEVEMSPAERALAEARWLHARDLAVAECRQLAELGVHKQLANRIIEPWMFITVILSATEFDNWFHLRNHPMAQPEIAWVAKSMWNQFHAPTSMPQELPAGGWHLPLIGGPETDDLDVETLKKISVGRCARVSYLTHEGKRDIDKDVELHDRLCSGPATGEPGHWSPFEHVAMALDTPERSGNFIGFRQYRKFFTNEHYYDAMP